MRVCYIGKLIFTYINMFTHVDIFCFEFVLIPTQTSESLLLSETVKILLGRVFLACFVEGQTSVPYPNQFYILYGKNFHSFSVLSSCFPFQEKWVKAQPWDFPTLNLYSHLALLSQVCDLHYTGTQQTNRVLPEISTLN